MIPPVHPITSQQLPLFSSSTSALYVLSSVPLTLHWSFTASSAFSILAQSFDLWRLISYSPPKAMKQRPQYFSLLFSIQPCSYNITVRAYSLIPKLISNAQKTSHSLPYSSLTMVTHCSTPPSPSLWSFLFLLLSSSLVMLLLRVTKMTCIF